MSPRDIAAFIDRCDTHNENVSYDTYGVSYE